MMSTRVALRRFIIALLIIPAWCFAIPIPTLPNDGLDQLPVSLSGMHTARISCVSAERFRTLVITLGVSVRDNGAFVEKVVVYRYGGTNFRVEKTTIRTEKTQQIVSVREWVYDGASSWLELDPDLPVTTWEEFWDLYAELWFATTRRDLQELSICRS